MAAAATMTPPTTNISAVAAAATAAAACTSSKHRPPNLPTPKSGTYPSSINSPLMPTPSHLKREEGLKTPVTPPSAYLDFLNKLSPAMKSPLSTGHSTTFSFAASGLRSPAMYPYPPAPASARPILTSNPSSSSVESAASLGSTSSSSTHTTQSAPAGQATKAGIRSTAVDVPRSVSTGPKTAPLRPGGPLRRPSLMIPPSPTTSIPSVMSPSSRMKSPVSAGAAAKAYYTSGSSPIDWEQALSAGAGKRRPVCVKEVVTRTMTYTRPRSSTTGSSALPLLALTKPKPQDEVMKRPIKEEPEEEQEEASENEQERVLAQKSTHGHHRLVGEAPRGKRRKIDPDT